MGPAGQSREIAHQRQAREQPANRQRDRGENIKRREAKKAHAKTVVGRLSPVNAAWAKRKRHCPSFERNPRIVCRWLAARETKCRCVFRDLSQMRCLASNLLIFQKVIAAERRVSVIIKAEPEAVSLDLTRTALIII